ELSKHHAPTVDQYVRDTFLPLPDDAIVVGSGDHNFFGALYVRRATTQSRTFDYLDPQLLVHRWYNERVTARLGIDFPYRGRDIDLEHLIDTLLATGRPVFATGSFHDALLAGHPSAPFGTLIRVYPADRRPPPSRLFRSNLEMFRSFAIQPRPEAAPNTWTRFILEDYSGTWRTLADALQATEHPQLADRARGLADRFAPWSVN
ncbi:MAG: hypothetical protein ABEN55_10285, partial [Bradymonadaceae bacterium]